MKNQVLVFTNSTFAYDKDEAKAVLRLSKELKRKNTLASIYWVYDVTNVKNDCEIQHENGIVTIDGIEHTAILRQLTNK